MSSSEYQEFMKFKAMQNERDTYRDLCGELLDLIEKTRDDIGDIKYSEPLNVIWRRLFHSEEVARARYAITKAEKILGAS